ncbi:hypothetical protein B0H63DRAFT_196625 [Podospora didyma]|uniref:CBM-cenC domain-containing protein n=1 Tax=Podospora didyma TaxID=330526 RepID=A0AAE0NGL4_9PEZI|nr:hypothetical protein B0H63DRAFT_196625 [Podospora didyma]
MQLLSLPRLILLALTSAGVSSAACASDNCYNQLARRTASASSFCATFTTATVTGVESFPTYLSTSCGPARASSACSCLWPGPTTATVTVTSTATVASCPASTNLVVNGAIPGLSPWTNLDQIISSSYGYNDPNITLSNGSPTGGAIVISGSGQYFDYQYELDQYITFPPRATRYRLTYWAKAIGGCRIYPTFGALSGGGRYDGGPVYPTGTWTSYSFTYTTDGSTQGFVGFAAQCSDSASKVLLDQISLVLA